MICNHFMFQIFKKWVTYLFAKNASSWQEYSDSDNHSSIQSTAFNSKHCIPSLQSEGCSCFTKVRTLKQDLWLLEVWKQPADNREALIHRCLNSQSIKNLIQHCYPPQASAKWNLCCGERNGMNTHSLVNGSNCLTQALSLFPFLQGRLRLTDIWW